MSDSFKFWLQTLIIPAVLLFIGYRINGTLQERQRAFDKIKFTEQILNDAFDTDKADKAFALAQLLPNLTNDDSLVRHLVDLINKHFTAQLAKAAQSGNESAFKEIADAAKTYSGNGVTVADSLKENPLTNKADMAIQLEQNGITLINQGKLDEAQKSFASAEKIYPSFHSSYEISNLLKSKVQEVDQGADAAVVQQQVMDTIRKNYSWKLNMRQNAPAIQRQ